MAAWLMELSWVAQFAGHGLAEKRAPALLDDLLGGACIVCSDFSFLPTQLNTTALVLAPFFVHLEILFACGYRPDFHREITNGVGSAIAKYRKEQGQARREKAH